MQVFQGLVIMYVLFSSNLHHIFTWGGKKTSFNTIEAIDKCCYI